MQTTKSVFTTWRAALAGGAMVAGALAAVPAQAQTTLTLNGWAGPTHLLTNDILVGWAKEVEKASNGRIKYSLLPKAPAAPSGAVDATINGLADVTYISHGLHPGRFTLTKLVEFPQMGSTGEINSVVYQRLHEKYLAQAGEHKGVKVLTMFTHGPGNIFTSKKQVLRPADLSGMKLRVGGGALSELMAALGATPVVRSASENYELLSNGVVDGTLTPDETIVSYKTEKIIRYGTRVPGGLYTLSFAVIMNEKTFNSLPKQDQDVINSLSGERYARLSGKAWDDKDAVGLDGMQKAGVQIVNADPSLVAAIREKAKPIEEAFFKLAKDKGVDGAKVLAEFREETRKLGGAQK